MKPRTVVLLLFICAIVGTGAWWALRSTTHRSQSTGGSVFPDFPVNDITKVVLSDSSGSVTLDKVNGIWVVPECHAYRANYDKVRDLLVNVADMKVSQRHRIRPASFGKMKLLGPDDPQAAANSQGTAISFHKGATRIAMFIVGVERQGNEEAGEDMFQYRPPNGQFIRVPALGDAVISVAEPFVLDKEGKNWIDRLLANIENVSVKSVTVTPPGGAPYTVARKERGAEFEMAGLNPTQQLVSAAASALGNALSFLNATTVVPPADAATNKALDKAWTLVCKTFDGPIYTLTLAASNQPAAYLKMAVAYEKPADPPATTNAAGECYKFEDIAKRLNEQVASWMYVIEDFKADELRKTLDVMVDAKPATEANAPPVTATEEPATKAPVVTPAAPAPAAPASTNAPAAAPPAAPAATAAPATVSTNGK